MSAQNYDLHWAAMRMRMPAKLKNYYKFKKFSDEVYKLDFENVVYHQDQKRPIKSLVYNEGSPNFNLFKLTPFGDMIIRFSVDDVWSTTAIDSDIFSKFSTMKNEKYHNASKEIYIDRPYDLFFMQLSKTFDYAAMQDALIYAKDSKTFTIFKGHPLAADAPSTDAWNLFSDLHSEYSMFISEANNHKLVQNAKRVYSADSATTLNAILLRKPVFTYRATDMFPIAPVITSAYEMSHIVPDEETVARYLSWYLHKLCIDIDTNFSEKIERIITMFNKGSTFSEIFR